MIPNTPEKLIQTAYIAGKLLGNAFATLYNWLPYKSFISFLPGFVAIGNRTNQDFKAVRASFANHWARVSYLFTRVELTPVK